MHQAGIDFAPSTAIVRSGFIAQEVDSVANACGFISSIVPNPTNSKVFIKTNNGEAITNIVVSDVTGRVVYENNFGSDVYEIENDFSYLQPNTYFVKINTTNNSYNTKFVIVK
jgi:hypothetical protein